MKRATIINLALSFSVLVMTDTSSIRPWVLMLLILWFWASAILAGRILRLR